VIYLANMVVGVKPKKQLQGAVRAFEVMLRRKPLKIS
jgi:hypothetical protein